MQFGNRICLLTDWVSHYHAYCRPVRGGRGTGPYKENQGDDTARGEVEDANPKVMSSPIFPVREPCA